MGDNAIGSAVSLRGGNSAQEVAHQQPQSIPGGDGHGVSSSEVELGAIQRNSAPPRVSRGGSSMLAAAGGGLLRVLLRVPRLGVSLRASRLGHLPVFLPVLLLNRLPL